MISTYSYLLLVLKNKVQIKHVIFIVVQIYYAFKLFCDCAYIYTYIYLRIHSHIHIAEKFYSSVTYIYFLDYNAMHNNIFGAFDKVAEVLAGRCISGPKITRDRILLERRVDAHCYTSSRNPKRKMTPRFRS